MVPVAPAVLVPVAALAAPVPVAPAVLVPAAAFFASVPVALVAVPAAAFVSAKNLNSSIRILVVAAAVT